MHRSTLIFVLSYVIWLVLSGRTEWFFAGAGVLCCLASVSLAARLERSTGGQKESAPFRWSRRTAAYFPWLLKEIWLAGLDVTQRVWCRSPSISPVLGWVRASQPCTEGLVLFANSITLTPGTVSVLVESDRVLVHSLSREGMEALQAGDFDRRVTEACSP